MTSDLSMVLLNWTAQNNLQIDGNVGWLAIQSTRREAILTYSGQNVPVHHWTKRTEDLQVRRFSGRIDRHRDYGLSLKAEASRSCD